MAMRLRVAALSLALAILAGCAAEAPSPTATQHIRGSPVLLSTQADAAADAGDTGAAADETENSATVGPILKQLAEVIEAELVHGPHQGMTAAIALLLGIVLVVKGKQVFDGLIILSVGYVMGVLAMSSVGEQWNLQPGSQLRSLVGWEIGLIGCWGAYKGLEGMNIFAGVVLGLVPTYYLQHVLVHIGAHFLDTNGGNQWAVVIFYTVFAGYFVYLFNGEAHKKLLALICPAIGGLLVASAIAYLFTAMMLTDLMSKQLANISPDLHPVGGSWIKFLEMLFWVGSKDVGIFAGSPFNKLGEKYTVDRLAGWTLWFICWIIGVVVSLKKKKKEAEAQAREPGLQQTLLPKADE